MDSTGLKSQRATRTVCEAGRPTNRSNRSINRSQPSSKAFPTFQGLRNNNDGTVAVDAVATPAITLTSEVAPKAKEVVVPELVPEVADMEEMLKELDACGVGFIASLKNEHRHDIVEQVSLFAIS
jgi:hypothetical protein